ncbi:MAG TPA: gamma-glutamylcyclotransferase family protein [Candidatus Limnocylindrales bacterium]|nr:gamma-glutamylcyclotransferase family protein [Candidatus Limnocylindrales bacterium]
MSARILIFAYGSNLCAERLTARTPSARAVGIGRLRGHRLCWHKKGRDGSGKCNALATGNAADVVWGVVYELDAAEKILLDGCEGLGRDYFEKTVTVEGNGHSWQAVVYCANQEMLDEAARPYGWYKTFVTTGARRHGLPEAYCMALEAVEACDDPLVARHRRELAVLAEVPHGAGEAAPVRDGEGGSAQQ